MHLVLTIPDDTKWPPYLRSVLHWSASACGRSSLHPGNALQLELVRGSAVPLLLCCRAPPRGFLALRLHLETVARRRSPIGTSDVHLLPGVVHRYTIYLLRQTLSRFNEIPGTDGVSH